MILQAIAWLLLATPGVHADDEAIGCYSVRKTAESKDGNGPTQAKQTSIRLTSEPSTAVSGHSDGLQVVPADKSVRFQYMSAYWTRDQGKIVIVFSNTGLSGFRMTLRKAKGGLEGVGEDFWDFPAPSEKQKYSLTKIPCKSK